MDEVASSLQYNLAVIVFTDIVGFSRLVSENEDEALPRAKAELMRLREICERHGGNVLKNTGDGLLMHFTSAVLAVACALEIQRTGTDEEGLVPLQHRIGIHLGDVTLEDGDVMGDSVNIAARLLSQADPGGICISKTVYDVVKNRLAIQATFLGPRELKNIREAVPIYKILIEAQMGRNLPFARSGRRPVWLIPLAAVLLFGVVVLAVIVGIHLGSHLGAAKSPAAVPPPVAVAPVATEVPAASPPPVVPAPSPPVVTPPPPAPTPPPAPVVAKPAPVLSADAARFVGAWEIPQNHAVMVFLPDGRFGVDLEMGDHHILGIVGTWTADAHSITTVRTDPAATTVMNLLSITGSQLIGQSDQGYRYLERTAMPDLPTVILSGISAATVKGTHHTRVALSTDLFPAAQNYNLGVTAFNDGDYDQAVARLTDALALKPDFELALVRRAEIYEIKNEFDKAAADFTELIRIKPRSVFALNGRALVYLKLGRYREAIEDVNSALSLRPDFYTAIETRGRANLLLGQYELAIADLDAVLVIKTDSIAALIDRGVAKKASGDIVGGQADLAQARKLQDATAEKSLTPRDHTPE